MIKPKFHPAIVLILLIIANCHSQNAKVIQLGEVFYNQNVRIQNDSIDSYYYFTEEGVCYGIDCKYKNTGAEDLEGIQNSFKGNWSKTPNGGTQKDDGYTAFDKAVSAMTDGGYSYRLGYDYLDVDSRGLVLVARDFNIEKSGLKPSRKERHFNSLNAFMTDPEVLAKQHELEGLEMERLEGQTMEIIENQKWEEERQRQQKIDDALPTEAIDLPYKLHFGWSAATLLTQLKSVFNDRVVTQKPETGGTFYAKIGVSAITYLIKSKTGMDELSIRALFYKTKSFSYTYEHWEHDLNATLQTKNADLVYRFSKLYHHDVLVAERLKNSKKAEDAEYVESYEEPDSEYSFKEIAVSETKLMLQREQEVFEKEQEELKKSKNIGSKM